MRLTNPFQLIPRNKPPNKRRAKPRRGRERDLAYMRWIRTLQCAVCKVQFEPLAKLLSLTGGLLGPTLVGHTRSTTFQIDGLKMTFVEKGHTEAAHVGQRGIGQKCSDRETVPLCAWHHRLGPESHHKLGKKFWEHHGIDRATLIRELNALYERRAA